MALNPTGPRLDLMRAIVADPGSVVYRRNWGHDPDEVVWTGLTRKRVTGVYRQLDEAKLVTLGPASHPSMYAPRPVIATDAGREWLAERDKEN